MSVFILSWLRVRFGDFEDASVFEARVSIGAYRIKNVKELNGTEAETAVPSLFRISASFTIKDPVSGELYGPTLTLQKCDPSPAAIDSLFSLGVTEWPDTGERYLGRFRPLNADLRLFKKWKYSCLDRHGEECRHRPTYLATTLQELRVIDVQQFCLVDVKQDKSWVSLSYCWGKAAVFTLQKHDLEELYMPGILRKKPISQVVQDAIAVTAAANERYLWVDGLCITQDDESEKQRIIPLMDEIYSASVFTIVDAAGADPRHGLSGVSTGSRCIRQELFVVKGTPLMEVLDPVNIFDASGVVSDSTWNSRAWTFQEGLLPPRLLIFAPEQVYWQCPRAAWCEDGCWEYFSGNIIYRHSHSDEFRELWSSADNVEHSYRRLVELYSQRAMSDASDGLNALSGILRALQARFGLDFIWGMPSRWLGAALTWPTEYDMNGVTRRSALVYPRLPGSDYEDSSEVRCKFPSWSWVGWEGKIIFDDLFGSLESRHAGLVFHTVDKTGETHIVEQHSTFKEKYALSNNEQRRRLAALAECPAWRDDSRTDITLKDMPAAMFRNNSWAIALAFWTSVARVEIQLVQAARRFDRAHKLFHHGKELQVMWNQPPRLDVATGPKTFFLVIVGRDTLSHIRSKDQLIAIVSECDRDDGLLERCGAVSMNEEDWIAIQDRSWEKSKRKASNRACCFTRLIDLWKVMCDQRKGCPCRARQQIKPWRTSTVYQEISIYDHGQLQYHR
ncbi:hypothetical protein AMS68_007143 [Peltaster fructicola]|uniref:Heterokaryon incompatibility domain-containing protein n=1 Tax=Peltaster fructicola TaxID=286661 RepID=A0A6H0Y3U4_9PEZI|nr:hypothetical protein AMS68_007143 [Peltaster fructicola]